MGVSPCFQRTLPFTDQIMPRTIINHIKTFTTLSLDTERSIAQRVRKKELRKDGMLKAHMDDFVFVESGLLLEIEDDSGRTAHIVPENDIILFPSAEESFSFVAVEPCLLWIMPHPDVMQLISRDTGLCTAYHLLMRYWAIQRMQIVDLLLLDAATRKETFYRRFRGVAHRIPNKYIASYLHMTPSYFSQL